MLAWYIISRQVNLSTDLKLSVFDRVKRFFHKSADTACVETDGSGAFQATRLTRSEHSISRDNISPNALKVLYRLNKAGYQAYLVGGCVRDLMLGLHPKDFDVTTNATPEQVKGLFRNCRLVGRRFRLAHVMFGREIIEVATFRGHHSDNDAQKGKQSEQGQLLRDNVFGTIEEDAQRRDFDVNAMYYNIADFSVEDFANGLNALEERCFNMIGDPDMRYREDPVRMLRAIRFSAKLRMSIGEATAAPIPALAPLLANIPPARLFEEVLKLFLNGRGLETFKLLRQYHLFEQLFPILTPHLKASDSREMRFLEQVLTNTDKRINSEKTVNPAFIYAAMLWYPVEERAQKLQFEGGFNYHDAFNLAITDVLDRQLQRIMIPKRFTAIIREIWMLQLRLPKRFGKRAFQHLSNPRFRAAYDFMWLRGMAEGGELAELADWWTRFQNVSEADRLKMVKALQAQDGKPRKRFKRRVKKTQS